MIDDDPTNAFIHWSINLIHFKIISKSEFTLYFLVTVPFPGIIVFMNSLGDIDIWNSFVADDNVIELEGEISGFFPSSQQLS